MPPRARRLPPSPAGAPAAGAPDASAAGAPASPPSPAAPTPLDVGRAVRRLRSAAGHSQEGFADAVGIHRTGQSALERGLVDPRLSTLAKIAAGLRMPVSHLLREIEREAMAPAPPSDAR